MKTEYISLGRGIARNFFRGYRDAFLNLSMDEDDVMQEMVLKLLEVEKKYESIDPEKQKYYIRKFCVWFLSGLIFEYIQKKEVKEENGATIIGKITIKKHKDFILHDIDIETAYYDAYQDPLILEIIDVSLNEKEKEILKRKVIFEETLDKIGKDLGFSSQWISLEYKRILSKLRTLMKEDQKLLS